MRSFIGKIRKIIISDKLFILFMILKRLNLRTFPLIVRRLSKNRMQRNCRYSDKTDIISLSINTPDGSNQCVHTDIIKICDSKYMMVITPYPFGWDVFENPVFYISSDLINWSYLSGPIDFPIQGEKHHFSDATIIMIEDKYYCYYRECDYDAIPNKTNIYMTTSNDGVSWDKRKKIFSENMSDCDIISPDINYDMNGFHCWFCLKSNDKIKLNYTADMGLTKKSFVEHIVEGIPENRILWHMSQVSYKDEGELFLFTIADEIGGANSELYLAYRIKNIQKISVLKKLDIKEKIPQIELEYRATGIIENDNLKIIASVMYKDYTWGLVLMEEKNVEDIFKCKTR